MEHVSPVAMLNRLKLLARQPRRAPHRAGTLPVLRDLDGFDFAAQPSLDKKQIGEIATGRFIADTEVAML